MYTYEQRLDVVKLYIKLGNKASQVKRVLGYPSKKYIRQWYLQYSKEGDLPHNYQRPFKYSEQKKLAAIDHYMSHGRCISFTVKTLGYPCKPVFKSWLVEYKEIIFDKNINNTASTNTVTLEEKRQSVAERK